jgi:hypothetical protein
VRKIQALLTGNRYTPTRTRKGLLGWFLGNCVKDRTAPPPNCGLHGCRFGAERTVLALFGEDPAAVS